MTNYTPLHSLHPVATVWRNLHSRCYNPNNNRYYTYGQRGIIVSPEWHLFSQFYADMFPSWKPGLQIDRIDNDGPYAKENCRWVSVAENARKRTNSKLTAAQASEIRKRYKPGVYYQKQLAEEFQVSDRMIRYIGKGGAWS